MKRFALYALNLAFVVLSGCAGIPAAEASTYEQTQGHGQTITSSEARIIMKENENFVLLDVRSQREFEQGHIEGALLLPSGNIIGQAEEEIPDKGTLILLYCQTGRRSYTAARSLVYLGFTRVYDFGGIVDWPYGIH